MKNVLLVVLKLCVSAGLLSLLLSRTGGDEILATIRTVDLGAFAAAVVCYIVSCMLSTLRWQMLIPQRLPARKLYSYYMIGVFFNNYLPGLIGGDAVKAYYLSGDLKANSASENTRQEPTIELTHHDAHRSVAFASVFMDRYLGFFSLIALGLAAYPFGPRWPSYPEVVWILPAFFCAGIVLSAVLAWIPIRRGPRFVITLSEYFGLYRSNAPLLCKAFLYSIVIQMLNFWAVYLLAQGLALRLDFITIVMNLPVVILITLLPISISGIGVRESAFIWLFGLAGVAAEKAIALSLLWFLSMVAAGIWGLIEYLRVRAALAPEKK